MGTQPKYVKLKMRGGPPQAKIVLSDDLAIASGGYMNRDRHCSIDEEN